MKSKINSLLAATSLFALSVPGTYAAELQAIPLRIKNQKITVEVAASQSTREHGLMNRFSLRRDEGMLFVFTQPQIIAMWMRNTYVPLSVAFIDSKGTILNIADMEPQTEVTHESAGAALYALEMRKGWFREHSIGAGAKIEGLDKAGRAEN